MDSDKFKAVMDEDSEDDDWDIFNEVVSEDISYDAISTHGDRVLIQYEDSNGVTKRGIIPIGLHTQSNGVLTDETESLIVPYGVDWYDLLEELIPDKEDFLMALASRFLEMGIWTYEDFRKKQPQEIVGAIIVASGVDYSKVNRIIESNK